MEEGGRGIGAGPAEPGQDVQAPAPGGRELAIIAPDVACRIRPSRTASGPRALRLDLHFRTDRADTIVAGEAWVFYPPRECWVAAEHTAPGDTDEHVLAMADRFLTSGEGWSTFNHLSLLTVLSVGGRGHREAVEGSAVLGLRRLELLRRVLGEFWPRGADAVTLAWIEALGNEIAYTAEGGAWTVSDEAYLTLYEKHRPDPFAEEIMWKFASKSDAYSCEGDPVCHVREGVNRRLARYWAEFPGGRYIARAVESGRTRLGYALEQCSAARAAGPDSQRARGWQWYRWNERSPEIVQALRASLEAVSEEEKAPLIARLGELEECGGAVSETGTDRRYGSGHTTRTVLPLRSTIITGPRSMSSPRSMVRRSAPANGGRGLGSVYASAADRSTEKPMSTRASRVIRLSGSRAPRT